MRYYCPRCKEDSLNAEMMEIITDLMSLEKNDFFEKRIDDPYYNKVIKNQMCFEIMRENCEKGMYANDIALLRQHFKLICENAMCFNKANTFGYQAAEHLLHDGLDYLDSKLPLKRAALNELEARSVSKRQKCNENGDSKPTEQPDISVEMTPEVLNIVINKRDIQPYLAHPPMLSFYPTPTAVIYIDPMLNFEELCYLCGSFIRKEQVWACQICSRAFHSFCLDSHAAGRDSWKCKDCRVCEICHNTQDALNMIYCKNCENAFDVSCLWPKIKGLIQLKN